MISDSRLPPRAWLIVVLLWFVVFSNFLARLLPTTMHGSLVAAIPMTEAQFGLLTSTVLWTYGLMSPFGGYLADRFSRSGVIITSMFLWSAITWLTSYTRTFEELLLLRALMGLSEACYLPAALALICDYHKGPTRSLATGIHQSGYVIGIGLSGLGGWLAEKRTWHYAFCLVGLASLAYCALLLFLLRDAPRGSRGGNPGSEARPVVRVGDALVSLFSRRSFILLSCYTTLGATITWTVYGWAPVFLQEHFHLTQGVAGLSAAGFMNAAAVPGLLIGGVWADRWSRTRRRARMFVGAIGLLGASLGIVLTANANVLVAMVLGLVIYRLFLSFMDANGMPILCEVVDSRYRATGYGILNLAGSVAAGFGVYYSGVLRDLKIDLHFVFDVLAGIAVICALLLYFSKPSPLVP